MGVRSIVSGLVFAGTIVVSATTVMDLGTRDLDRDDATFSLAPISLGHPAAAATLSTRRVLPPEATPTVRPDITEDLTIGRGDTLAEILIRAGAPAVDVDRAIRAFRTLYDPRRLKVGQKVTVVFRASAPVVEDTGDAQASAAPGSFFGFSFQPDYKSVIAVQPDAEGAFKAEKQDVELKRTLTRVTAEIQSSLYLAGSRAGLPQAALAELVRIYSWDVDFQRDIRKGDQIDVVFEEIRNDDGKIVDTGPIHFAALTLSGDRRPLYRFVTEEGFADYFDDKGKGAKKALMRTPIDGARLSSGFGKRKHPILGYNRMHRGLDFAAPTGTPIYAAGDGVLDYVGRKGAYGKYMRIRHNGKYSTAYAHLHRYAKGMGKGKRVRQGQVIGYVGSTGRSTGPHLHYEILVDGVQRNPLKIKMPSGRKLKGRELERFHIARTELKDQFAGLKPPAKEVASTSN